MHRVFDDRQSEITLYQSEDGFGCMIWISNNYTEEHEAFSHIWMEEVKK